MAVLEIWYSAVYSVLCIHFSSFHGDIAKPFKNKYIKQKAMFPKTDSSNKLHSVKE